MCEHCDFPEGVNSMPAWDLLPGDFLRINIALTPSDPPEYRWAEVLSVDPYYAAADNFPMDFPEGMLPVEGWMIYLVCWETMEVTGSFVSPLFAAAHWRSYNSGAPRI